MNSNKTVFDTVAVKAPRYSTFDLSHDHKLSMKMGYLVPVYTQECIPGDKFELASEAMFRLMPMISPIMHKVDVTFHHFFCPNRILWENWEKYITGGDNFDSSDTPPVHPTFAFNSVDASTLGNYLGLPVVPSGASMVVNALPFAAYYRIYRDWYRDENLQLIDKLMLQDGDNSTYFTEMTTLRKRAWEHDYFTSCLPFAQKGDAVELPLDFQDVPVKYRLSHPAMYIRNASTGAVETGGTSRYQGVGTGGEATFRETSGTPTDLHNIILDPNDNLYVDADDLATTTTINDLRTAWALQQFLEKNMRAGSRYREALFAHFGVHSSDKRLDRPEYLGGGKGTVAVSEVLQTSSTDSTTPQANMAGHGISVMQTNQCSYHCEEHGFIITILSIMPRTAYYQGLPRWFNKSDRTQYAFPDFAQLGEQEVLNKEVFYDNADGLNDDVFGYIPRYAEYRYSPSRVSGQMATSLDFWHMSRKFANRPHLNSDFVSCDATTRIFAVSGTGDDTMVAHIFNRVRARRPLPMFGVPALLV